MVMTWPGPERNAASSGARASRKGRAWRSHFFEEFSQIGPVWCGRQRRARAPVQPQVPFRANSIACAMRRCARSECGSFPGLRSFCNSFDERHWLNLMACGISRHSVTMIVRQWLLLPAQFCKSSPLDQPSPFGRCPHESKPVAGPDFRLCKHLF
jgi:hypothetical protein